MAFTFTFKQICEWHLNELTKMFRKMYDYCFEPEKLKSQTSQIIIKKELSWDTIDLKHGG